jgi:hypothetical protein
MVLNFEKVPIIQPKTIAEKINFICPTINEETGARFGPFVFPEQFVSYKPDQHLPMISIKFIDGSTMVAKRTSTGYMYDVDIDNKQ